jgi:parallel beta-helix repeat protein
VPSEFVDSTCGNCEDPNTTVNATFGLHITGKWVQIIGPPDKSAVIHTHAGYGLFFNSCQDALIENISVTGGQRDLDGHATNAAIVVKNSTIVIRSNRIFDNIGDSAIVMSNVVGIMGICGREYSKMFLVGNEIKRNSWDGIALYRDAEATIENNIIDGVDKARGKQVGGGRGVAIGVTWDADAKIKGNLVTRYWKGIGLFVDAKGVVRENIIEDILTWGIALWDADKGKPEGIIENNIIYKTGACGASITRSAEGEKPGKFVGNIIARTAQDPKYDSPDYYCYQCALALHAVPQTFQIENNIFYDNRRAMEDLPDHDIQREEFLAAIEATHRKLSADPILRQSDFVTDFSIDN